MAGVEGLRRMEVAVGGLLLSQLKMAEEELQARGEAAMAPREPALQINIVPWPADRICFLGV